MKLTSLDSLITSKGIPVQKLKVNGGWWQFTEPLRYGMDFRTHGALSGRSLWQGMHRHGECFCRETASGGQLPGHYIDSFAHAKYAVFSYDTPIAWLNEDDVWITPGIKYSVTTSKHQGRIFTAIGQLS